MGLNFTNYNPRQKQQEEKKRNHKNDNDGKEYDPLDRNELN